MSQGYCELMFREDPDSEDVLTKEVQIRLLFGWLLRMKGFDDMSLDVLNKTLKLMKNIFVIKHVFPEHGIYVSLDSLPKHFYEYSRNIPVILYPYTSGDGIIKYPGRQWCDYKSFAFGKNAGRRPQC